MATTEEFKDFVLEQLQMIVIDSQNLANLCFSARKMFGEYCVYVHEYNQKKVLFLLCNNMVFLKQHQALESLLISCTKAPPFQGAKAYYVIDIESTELLHEILIIIVPLLKSPKYKHKKRTNNFTKLQ